MASCPDKKGKYIVIGNPPFGLRGNLALRFMNHSYDFADVIAFILPRIYNKVNTYCAENAAHGARRGI